MAGKLFNESSGCSAFCVNLILLLLRIVTHVIKTRWVESGHVFSGNPKHPQSGFL